MHGRCHGWQGVKSTFRTRVTHKSGMTRFRLCEAAWLLLLGLLLSAPSSVRLQQAPDPDSVPLDSGAEQTNVQTVGQDGNGVEDDVTQEARSQDSEERSSASFGPVTSPFFFMCQYPRQGEASGVEGQDDLSVKVEFVGSNRPDQGYQPHTVYE
ncbi:uncharacterized protein LOC122251517, partial [Penaeus japonicus]|uniref:uncharacterized protein LOC122251517 n=1 Tax=Penaeus japonicus TaxID=27405 RepID=UPI001C70EA3D